MTTPRLRCLVTASTQGSVLSTVLANPFFRSCVDTVVTDRRCGALDAAAAHGVRAHCFASESNEAFCERLLDHLAAQPVDYVFSFYTQFYTRRMRDALSDRIVNFHPSLLPAFKGHDPFGDACRYGARFAGVTAELIAERMDEGKIIMQSVLPLDPQRMLRVRHGLYEQTCKMVLQVARWLHDGRVAVHGERVRIDGARYDDTGFAPALDFADAVALRVPYPGDAVMRGLGAAAVAP